MLSLPDVFSEVRGSTCRHAGFVLVLFWLIGCADQRDDDLAITPAPSSMRMDGIFDDWQDIADTLDDSGDAAEAELDIGALRMHSDDRFVYLSIGLNRELNVQRLDGTLELLMDGDGDSNTGRPHHGMSGVDLIIRFSPEDPQRPEADHMGVAVASTTFDPSDPADFVHHSDVGFLLAPTYASNRIECRLNRDSVLPDTPRLFGGESIAMKLVLINAEGGVSDDTEVVSHTFPSVSSEGNRPVLAENLPARAGGSLRVMSWNVLNGNILKKPDLYAKMLLALDPDVILFEEVAGDSLPALESFFFERLSLNGDAWNVVLGHGGGPSRCAIASRLPMEEDSSLRWIPYPERPDRSVRTMGGSVTVGDRRLLVAPVHLKCCGRIDSWEDERRLEEVKLINRAVAEAMTSAGYDGVVIGGDLNLVGGSLPITALGANLDLDQSELTILEAYHLHGEENTTWASNRERFVPGRLDFLLYSDSVLTAANAFVFDTADLSEAWLAGQALSREASMNASDHLPVVADFVWSG